MFLFCFPANRLLLSISLSNSNPNASQHKQQAASRQAGSSFQLSSPRSSLSSLSASAPFKKVVRDLVRVSVVVPEELCTADEKEAPVDEPLDGVFLAVGFGQDGHDLGLFLVDQDKPRLECALVVRSVDAPVALDFELVLEVEQQGIAVGGGEAWVGVE